MRTSPSFTWRLTPSDSGRITELATAERVGIVRPINVMAQWLKAVYPDVWESIDWAGPGIGDPEGLAATLFEYYDEFVTQSDEYSYTD